MLVNCARGNFCKAFFDFNLAALTQFEDAVQAAVALLVEAAETQPPLRARRLCPYGEGGFSGG
jgi:hypothetical protein